MVEPNVIEDKFNLMNILFYKVSLDLQFLILLKDLKDISLSK